MIFETFWEPGGDVIHYQDGNNLADAPTRFVVVMFVFQASRCSSR